MALNRNNFIRWWNANWNTLTGYVYQFTSVDEVPQQINIDPDITDKITWESPITGGFATVRVGIAYTAKSVMRFKTTMVNLDDASNPFRYQIIGKKISDGLWDISSLIDDIAPFATGTYEFDFTYNIDLNTYDEVSVCVLGLNHTGREMVGELTVENNPQPDFDNLYPPKIIQGKTIGVYMNVDELFSDNFDDLSVALLKDEVIWIEDITTLNKVIIDGSDYRMYFEWVVPLLAQGCYQFGILNDALYGQIKYISNEVQWRPAETEYIRQTQYTNPQNILNYDYVESGITNQIGLDLFIGKPDFTEDATAYQKYDGSTVRVRSQVFKTYEVQLRDFDQDAMQAFKAAALHETLKISDNDGGFKDLYLGSDSDLSINWNDKDQVLARGDINLIDRDYQQEDDCSPDVVIDDNISALSPDNWYRSQVGSSITEDGVGITEWIDQGALDYDVSQSTDADKPANNVNEIEFDSSDNLTDSISEYANSEWQIFMVLKPLGDNLESFFTISDANTNTWLKIGVDDTNKFVGESRYDGGPTVTVFKAKTDNNKVLLTTTHKDNEVTLRVNDGTVDDDTSAGTFDKAKFDIMGMNKITAPITINYDGAFYYEIVVFNRILSTDDEALVRNQLNDQWATF